MNDDEFKYPLPGISTYFSSDPKFFEFFIIETLPDRGEMIIEGRLLMDVPRVGKNLNLFGRRWKTIESITGHTRRVRIKLIK